MITSVHDRNGRNGVLRPLPGMSANRSAKRREKGRRSSPAIQSAPTTPCERIVLAVAAASLKLSGLTTAEHKQLPKPCYAWRTLERDVTFPKTTVYDYTVESLAGADEGWNLRPEQSDVSGVINNIKEVVAHQAEHYFKGWRHRQSDGALQIKVVHGPDKYVITLRQVLVLSVP